MGLKTVVVCDVCDKPAITTLSFRIEGAGYQVDLCKTHRDWLVRNARRAKKGRPYTKNGSRIPAAMKKETARYAAKKKPVKKRV